MNAKALQNLDQVMSERGCNARLEMSLTIDEFSAALARVSSWDNSSDLGEEYYVDGLGLWRAFAIAFDEIGDVWFAVPSHDRTAGCSVWYNGYRISAAQLARHLTTLAGPAHVDFLNPETGEFIEPARVPRSRNIASTTSTAAPMMTFVTKSSWKTSL